MQSRVKWRKVIEVVKCQPGCRANGRKEEKEEVEEPKTASFQIPTSSLLVIFPSNVEHTVCN
jgi:hypothetical protein